MLKLVKNGNVVTDVWKTLVLAEGDTPENVRLPVGPVLVPAAVWKARRAELIRREYEHGWPLGVWLAADEGADEIGRDVDDFTVIAVAFDRFSDGKSYATACDLRERYGFTGELRATGDVPRDRLGYRRDVGFDAVVVAADREFPASAVLKSPVLKSPVLESPVLESPVLKSDVPLRRPPRRAMA